jgi:Histidine kinase-like ATPase domain
MNHNTSAGHPYPADAGTSQRPTAPAAQGVDVLRWRQVLRGEAGQLRVLRRWLASMLPDCPARDDVISVATELASNALRHTASGRGGWFAVEITRYPSVVRIAVADQGGPAEPRVIDDPAAENGRGLLLVSGLSLRTGMTGDQRGRLIWADIAFDSPDATPPDPYDVSIRDGQAALTRRFADVPTWFGRSTLAWWALAGSRGLVTAPSAAELAATLYRLRASPAQDPQPVAEDTECSPAPAQRGRQRRGVGIRRGGAGGSAARPRMAYDRRPLAVVG